MINFWGQHFMDPTSLPIRIMRVVNCTFYICRDEAFVILFCALFAVFSAADAKAQSNTSCILPELDQSLLPGNSKEWLSTERWVWIKLYQGETADFHAVYCEDLTPDRTDSRWFSKERARNIRGSFLAELISSTNFSEKLFINGVRIYGAVVDGDINAPNSNIKPFLCICQSIIGGRINFTQSDFAKSMVFEDDLIDGNFIAPQAKSEHSLVFKHSIINGGIDIRGSNFDEVSVDQVEVSGDVTLDRSKYSGSAVFSDSEFYKDFRAPGISVGGQFIIKKIKLRKSWFFVSAKFNGGFIIDNSEFDGSVDGVGFYAGSTSGIYGSKFKNDVFLNEMKSVGQIAFVSTTISGSLYLINSEIGGDLYFTTDKKWRNASAVHGSTRLVGAKINGKFWTDSTAFLEQVVAEGMTVKNSVNIAKTEFAKSLSFQRSKIDTQLRFYQCVFKGLVNFNGSSISGNFLLSSDIDSKIEWSKESSLSLVNATVGSWQDYPYKKDFLSNWPQKGNLHLNGFSYSRIGSETLNSRSDIVERPTSFFVDWLDLSPKFTPQPYKQMASVLIAYGETKKAENVLYYGRERARKRAYDDGDLSSFFGLSMLKYTIGYGIGLGSFLALIWIFLSIMNGAFIVYIASGAFEKRSFMWCIEVSFDEMLPFSSIYSEQEKALSKMKLKWKALFYLQKAAVYVLGTFVAAGVAGLTQS